MLHLKIRGAQSVYGEKRHWGVGKVKINDLQISQKTLVINNTQSKVCDDLLFHSTFIAQSWGLTKLPLHVTSSVHSRPDVPPACIFSVGSCMICLWSISLRQFGRPFPGRCWNAGTGGGKKGLKSVLWTLWPVYRSKLYSPKCDLLWNTLWILLHVRR